jgi:hypothetical protein
MIELEKQFIGTGDVKGHVFTQVENNKGFIYKVEYDDTEHYEVFLRKTTPICLDFEKKIYSETEFKERYPKSKDFGVWAWCCKNIKNAYKRLENETIL